MNKNELLFDRDDGTKLLYFNTGTITYSNTGEPIDLYTNSPKKGELVSIVPYFSKKYLENASLEKLLEIMELPGVNWKNVETEKNHFLVGVLWWAGCTFLQGYVTTRNELLKRNTEIDIIQYDVRLRESVKDSQLYSELFEDLLKLKPESIRFSDDDGDVDTADGGVALPSILT
jgi:hypothetical protein